MDGRSVARFGALPSTGFDGRTRILMAAGKATGKGSKVSADSIDIRKCHQLDEMRACVRLQQEVWNFSDADLVPLRMFVVAEKIGGQVIAAFAGNETVGFALSIPGVRGGQSY